MDAGGSNVSGKDKEELNVPTGFFVSGSLNRLASPGGRFKLHLLALPRKGVVQCADLLNGSKRAVFFFMFFPDIL